MGGLTNHDDCEHANPFYGRAVGGPECSTRNQLPSDIYVALLTVGLAADLISAAIARLETNINKNDAIIRVSIFLATREALDDYAAWVRTVTPDHFDFPPIAMFKPLWQNPDHPAIAAAAVALFDDPKSPWNPQVWRGDATVAEGQQRDLFATPLLGLKAFRTLVIRALGDRTQVGTIETDAEGAGDRDPGALQDRERWRKHRARGRI